ncbi:PD-(D/E)XK nuclease family protein [Streptomyces yunnanensis]|uniref:PD-(D/E)XK nuclease family protein n=1 Tax=Streptomyces yunnanensis TaxID=156453 RepID=A0ABY8A235_9ACTN|nr:PD-(D/E)XK nuclease family protein [Streptomyces yunnanensis]WEB38749.1 PD-(D/E)XK nuclease family protein [Streptomyces yunnanensis]
MSEHYSVSQYTTYAQCAHQWRLQRRERAPQRQAAWFEHGKAFHAAIEQYERHGRTLGPETVVGFFEHEYDMGIEAALDREPEPYMWMAGGRTKPETDIKRRLDVGAQQTRDYITWAQQSPDRIWTTPDGRAAIELEFRLDLDGVAVVGFIDQIVEHPERGLVVRDLKTGTTRSLFQLATYKIAIEELYGVEVNYGDWYMAKTGGLSEPVDLRYVTRDWLAEQYSMLDRGIKNEVFIPNPGSHCFACTVKPSCNYAS